MPVDPQAQVLLDQLAAVDGPDLSTLSAPDARVAFQAFASMLPVPETAHVNDHRVAVDGGEITVRVFHPLEYDRFNPLPVLVWFHGGGFTVGDLSTSDGTAAELANSTGCVVANVDYRLAPEHGFPTPLEDCYAAVQWVVDASGDLGVDPARLAVGGDSAGGNLAAAVCLLARELGGPAIRFQVLVYPCVDPRGGYPSFRENGEGYFLTAQTMEWFWANNLGASTDPETPLAAPLYAGDLSGLPAGLLVTAEYDPLRDEGEAYGERLRRAGVPVEVSRYDGQIHGFVGLYGIMEAGRKGIDEIARALRSAL